LFDRPKPTAGCSANGGEEEEEEEEEEGEEEEDIYYCMLNFDGKR
jgi:ribosomal protein L12E/L44/L45/RPP1/RPP2